METNGASKILAFCREHKKYVILFGIYLICFIISMAYNPWDQHFSYELMGETYDMVYSPETEFYHDYFPEWLLDYGSAVGWIIVRLLTLGVGDLINLFSLPSMSRINEVLMIVFPTVMFLKAMIMKRFFAKEKDKVTLNEKKFTLLYYRSESIIAEIAADNTAFFLIGILTRGIFALGSRIETLTGGASDSVFDIFYCIMLIPCFIPYTSTEWLMDRYNDILYAVSDILYNISGDNTAITILIFFICFPIINFILIWCFEMILKLSMRLVTAFGSGLGWFIKNTKTLVTEKINT